MMVERSRKGVMVTLPKEELDALRAEIAHLRQGLDQPMPKKACHAEGGDEGESMTPAQRDRIVKAAMQLVNLKQPYHYNFSVYPLTPSGVRKSLISE